MNGRTKKSIKNGIVAGLMYLITILFGFLSQKVFINTLGNEYLGINGLFSNVLSMLAIVELGFGSAIIYNLYKPIADRDEEKVRTLMQFYRKTYNIIACTIFVLGMIVLPFIKNIVGKVTIKENIYFLFFLSLLDIVTPYLLTYKRSILYADQKIYLINIVHIGYVVLLNSFEIILLNKFKNYVLYLILKIIFRILENVVDTIIANKKYKYITIKSNEELDTATKNDIYKKVRGLLFHKIGGALVLSSDNIIISKIFGVVTVGLYSNYYLIISAVNNFFGQIFTSIVASVGNLLLENDKDKSYKIYRNILFFNSWIYNFAGICILCLIEPFISIWIGNQYLLDYSVLITLVVNFYVQGMRKTSNLFKEAAGIFYEDRFVPLIESGINVISSIVLAKIFGLSGVFMGTILSSMVLFLYSYPVFVYEKIFKRKYKNFIIEHLRYLGISIIITIITVIIVNQFNANNMLLQLIINAIICIIVPNIIYTVLFRKTEEFKYFYNLIKKFLKKTKDA